MDLYDYAGVIHLHSAYSFDGRTSVDEIVRAADETGTDFLMITDHFTLEARKKGQEGWHDGVLLVVGQEISPRFNHYLAFGVDEEIILDESDEHASPQEYIDKVRQHGGIGFIAHPDHEGTKLFHVKQFPWKDWSVSGYTGMGVWDFMTDWQSTLRSLPRALAGYLCPAYVLRGPREITLKRWDRLNQQGKVVGIGELDNHDTPYTIGKMTIGIFPFRRVLRLVRTHILLDSPLSGQAGDDMNRLLHALAHGRTYIAMEHFRNAKGFSFMVTDADRDFTMGDELVLQGEGLLQVTVPHAGRIHIIRNGHCCAQRVGTEMRYAIKKRGVYRVEVYATVWGHYRPWIFSNPVYVI